MSDLGDSPTGRAECNDVARPGLIDHLLVEFADPRGFFAHQVHREHPAVRNRPSGGDREPLGAGACGQGGGIAVVDQSRPQFGEVRRRILAAQQIQGGFKGAARQGRERGTAPDGVEPLLDEQWARRAGRHGVLGQDVQRVGRHRHGFDRPGDHALHADRAADQIGAVLGQQDPPGDLADLVAGAADPLKSAGHRRRRLDLDDEIDRTHVDAEFQARRRHHRLESPTFEFVLHGRAFLFGHRPVMGPGQQCLGALDLIAGQHLGRGRRQFNTVALGVDLVDPGGESLRDASGVGEDDGRGVRVDEVDDAGLDVGPDGVVLQIGHIRHRHLNGEVEGLGCRRCDDDGRPAAGEKPGHLLRWAHRRRQPDPLSRFRQ